MWLSLRPFRIRTISQKQNLYIQGFNRGLIFFTPKIELVFLAYSFNSAIFFKCTGQSYFLFRNHPDLLIFLNFSLTFGRNSAGIKLVGNYKMGHCSGMVIFGVQPQCIFSLDPVPWWSAWISRFQIAQNWISHFGDAEFFVFGSDFLCRFSSPKIGMWKFTSS